MLNQSLVSASRLGKCRDTEFIKLAKVIKISEIPVVVAAVADIEYFAHEEARIFSKVSK